MHKGLGWSGHVDLDASAVLFDEALNHIQDVFHYGTNSRTNANGKC